MAGNATVKDRRKSKPRIAGSRHVHAGSRSSSDTSLRADPWRELEELKQENASLRIRNEELTQENTDLRKVVDTLTESVNCLKKALSDFTCRSEELAQDSENQKLLLQEELNEARRRLNQNSSNSSMPPSSDGYRKPARKGTRSLRGNSGRNPGGQNGHTGRTLRQVEHPDSVVDHDPEFCSRCGAHLSEEHRICHSSRQVFDLQDGRLTVTEHRAYSSECPHCHEETAAEFPEDVTAPVQYGPTLCGHIVALHVVIQIPINKIIAVMNYFFNVKLSQGTVVRVCRKKAVLLKKGRRCSRKEDLQGEQDQASRRDGMSSFRKAALAPCSLDWKADMLPGQKDAWGSVRQPAWNSGSRSFLLLLQDRGDRACSMQCPSPSGALFHH